MINNYVKVVASDSVGTTILFMATFDESNQVGTARALSEAALEADKIKNAKVVLYRRMDEDLPSTKSCQVVTPCHETGHEHVTERDSHQRLGCKRCNRMM